MEFIIEKQSALLLLIDFQEKLMPGMKNANELEQTVVRMIKGCRALGVPILATQQYTRGLGETIPGIKEVMGEETCVIEKTSFSCCGQEGFIEAVEEYNKETILVAGIEAHICVQQTVMDLLKKDYEVFVLADCIASRNNNDKKYAQRRMSEMGAMITTYESALFEMLRDAKAPEFKAISAIVR